MVRRRICGTSHPSLPVETEAMKKAATRLAGDLGGLGNLFPAGFVNLESALKSW
jgi:hypothetical protein